VCAILTLNDGGWGGPRVGVGLIPPTTPARGSIPRFEMTIVPDVGAVDRRHRGVRCRSVQRVVLGVHSICSRINQQHPVPMSANHFERPDNRREDLHHEHVHNPQQASAPLFRPYRLSTYRFLCFGLPPTGYAYLRYVSVFNDCQAY
jgi:hypothetical protein